MSNKNNHIGMIEKGQIWSDDYHGSHLILEVFHHKFDPGQSYVRTLDIKNKKHTTFHPMNLIHLTLMGESGG